MHKLKKKLEFTGTIRLITGMHIGGSSEGMDIGGVDATVIKDPLTKRPYIPGSSLKGKLRSLIQQTEGSSECHHDSKYLSSSLFGGLAKKGDPQSKTCTSRLIVRDAFMTDKTVIKLQKASQMDMPWTEIKWETAIDRVNGTAKNGSLRQFERVPAGSEFDFSIILNVYDDEDEAEYRKMLNTAVKLLEMDYLGGSGTRGYGQVKFSDGWDKPEELNVADLKTNG